MNNVRVGVDVGGTFTDVVALDTRTRQLVARFKVPTTHSAPEGVAAGIIAAIERLVREGGVDPAGVAFIAHSTTQATNSLLEGDVAKVAIVGLLDRFGILARMQMSIRPFDLAAGARFSPITLYADGAASARKAIDDAQRSGAQAIAVSEPFSVDRPAREQDAVGYARSRGIAATGGHEVSSMYGLRARTRTAALNAAILPKMMQTAQMTNDAVQRATIAAPLMIMRSDGGVMNLPEVQRRPIMTLLSGPAAGIAGALLHENVTDGVFIEVGGTSSDCSAIRSGMPQMRPARVGGHRTMLRTLDVRTLGIAGGSMLRATQR
ncbi:MAG: hydantoinase/oxoprolinase, partial [Candidatus Eremiobacteraeota bacterium]|nr:hydantoinase/oxoprolinase [Candidatus Eremiobacteraeota bacterium]